MDTLSIVDRTSDSNLQLLNAIANVVAMPSYVKSAADSDVSKLPPTAFADPVNRRFPCHTRADTWLSYAYAAKQAIDKNSNVWRELQKFASVWCIDVECAQLDAAFTKASSSLETAPDDHFAIVQPMGNSLYRALPIDTPDNVKQAAAHVVKYAARYPIAWRRQAAERITKAAAAHNVELDNPYFYSATSQCVASPADAAQVIYNRVLLAKNIDLDNQQTEMAKFASTLLSSETFNVAAVEEALDTFDRMYGLQDQYGTGGVIPPEAAFRLITKAAADQAIVLATRSKYSKSALASAPLDVFSVVGNDLVNAISTGINPAKLDMDKAAAVLPTLPLPDAKLLDVALSRAGIRKEL